jgi:GMC oxidoreductase
VLVHVSASYALIDEFLQTLIAVKSHTHSDLEKYVHDARVLADRTMPEAGVSCSRFHGVRDLFGAADRVRPDSGSRPDMLNAGPVHNPLAVVDDKVRVRGHEGLRVACSSIMPTISSDNTHAAKSVAADKAAFPHQRAAGDGAMGGGRHWLPHIIRRMSDSA